MNFKPKLKLYIFKLNKLLSYFIFLCILVFQIFDLLFLIWFFPLWLFLVLNFPSIWILLHFYFFIIYIIFRIFNIFIISLPLLTKFDSNLLTLDLLKKSFWLITAFLLSLCFNHILLYNLLLVKWFLFSFWNWVKKAVFNQQTCTTTDNT